MVIRERHISFLVYSLTLGGALLWFGALFLAPYFRAHQSPVSVFLYTAFSNVCHQIPSRSFQIFGYPLAVCSRCLGIYSGFLLGTIIYPWRYGFLPISLPKTKTFFWVTAPIVIDTSGNFFSIWNTPGWIRFGAGILWGIILPFYFIPGLTEFALECKTRNKSYSFLKSLGKKK